MAQYKVLQDIEAEDKLLGPLSLRQFIYAAIAIGTGFLAFRLFASPAWFLGAIFLPPALFFGLLAAPIGGQQSSELWLLAKIRFFLKPKKRLWDQSGVQDLVTITVPKKIEKQLTKGYSQEEVKSRLRTLSTTLDTRGWAVKNATENMYAAQGADSDRLLNIDAQSAPAANVEPDADILDENVNPRARNMDQLIQKSAAIHKDTIMENIRRQQQANQTTRAVSQPPTLNEQQLLDKIHREHAQAQESTSHLKTLQPLSAQQPAQDKNTTNQVTSPPDPAILNRVKDSEGLSVQSVAHLANRKKEDSDDEVVISLH